MLLRVGDSWKWKPRSPPPSALSPNFPLSSADSTLEVSWSFNCPRFERAACLVPLMKPPGENRFGTFLVLSLVAVAIYAAVLLSGVFFDHYQVKQAVRAAHSRARQDSDEMLRTQILRGSLREVGTHWEDAGTGNLQEAPGLGLSEVDIVIKRDANESVLIRISYERRIRLKPSDRFVTLTLRAEKDGIPP